MTAEITRTEAKQLKRLLLPDAVKRLFREKPLGVVGGIIVLTMLVVGIFADFLMPYGYNEMSFADHLKGPSFKHLLGTDNLGRDTLSRIIYGARISLVVGMVGTSISTLVAVIIGLISGYVGGKLDLTVQRIVDAFMCFPAIFLMLTIMVLVGPGLYQVTIVLGLLWGIWYSRVIRGAVIGIKENVYVQAAITIGCPPWRILLLHILPNVMASVIILFTITIGQLIMAEASLSFLGYGIPPPQPSWGGMLSLEGREYMIESPWLALWPGVALGIVVYGVNMLGDALRDILDPRLRGRLGSFGDTKKEVKPDPGSKG
jgi:peptide/nickel transport system permease protein